MEPDQIFAALRRLEEKFDKVDDKLDEFIRDHGTKLAVLDQRVTQMEVQLKTSGDRRWLLILAVLASITALFGSFVAPLIVR